MSGSIQPVSGAVSGDVVPFDKRQLVKLQVEAGIQQEKSYMRARVAMGRKDDQESASTDTLMLDERINQHGREILAIVDKMGVAGSQKGAADLDLLLKGLRTDTETCLTRLQYREVAVKQDAYAMDLSKIKYTLASSSTALAVGLGGPQAAGRAVTWANTSVVGGEMRLARAVNSEHGFLDKGTEPPHKVTQELRSANRNLNWKRVQAKVIERLSSPVKTPLRANLAVAVIQTVGMVADIHAAMKEGSQGVKEEGKAPGSDLIA